MEQPILECPITELLVNYSRIFSHPNSSGESQYIYSINVNGSDVKIIVPISYTTWFEDSFFAANKHIIVGLLLNQRFFTFDTEWHTLSLASIKRKFEESTFPHTPQEKYDNLFSALFNQQAYDGQIIQVRSDGNSPIFHKKLYFKTDDELIFYARSLQSDNLIDAEFIDASSRDGDVTIFSKYRMTFKALSYALKLANEGKQSRNCFIAMSFGEDMGLIRNAIKEACLATGYVPVLVDEVHYDSDTTINDAIVANLKKSRFCIADFTEQKDGVYFESGFALGQGKQVIYSCREDYFKASHFDTNHFPHIVYKDPEELKRGLIAKIEAWIR